MIDHTYLIEILAEIVLFARMAITILLVIQFGHCNAKAMQRAVIYW